MSSIDYTTFTTPGTNRNYNRIVTFPIAFDSIPKVFLSLHSIDANDGT